jgi:hypothetical protein
VMDDNSRWNKNPWVWVMSVQRVREVGQ